MRAIGKAIPFLLLATLLALLIGCGGGGGGGGTTNGSTNATNATNTTSTTSNPTTTTQPVTSLQIEAYDSPADIVADSGSVHQGEVYQLRLFGRNTSDSIVYPTGTLWTTDAAAGEATVSSSGILTIVGTSGTFVVRANTTTTLQFIIRSSDEAILIGKVRNQENQGVPNALIKTTRANGAAVRTGRSGSNGTFRLSVPTTATRFDVNFDDIIAKYYNVWSYGEPTYSPGACPNVVPLPALSSGQPSVLPVQIVLYRRNSNPPPVPDCEVP